jgi:pimeloyl-ACP methyl ester carboxylesterase
MPGVETFIKEGYVVVATDYQGLGGGGKHQYAVAGTQARDVLDSIRATASLKDSGAGKRAIVYGWSQGGGAAIALASLYDYVGLKGTAADGVELLGFVGLAPFDTAVVAAGGGALDAAKAETVMSQLAATFSTNVFNFAHFAMSLWGTQAAYPNLRLEDVFTEEGAKVLDRVFSNKCMHAGADTLNYAYGTEYKSLVRPSPSNALPWVQALIDGSVPPVKPMAPVIIYWGTKDTTNPPIMGKLYQDQMCKLGGNVERVQLPGEQTHFTTPGTALPLFVSWMKDRFGGKAAANGCTAN